MKITKEQNEKFKEITGQEFPGEIEGEFQTQKPYNDEDYNYSPYYVKYEIVKKENLLCIELGHRMTNTHAYVIDENGEYVEDSRYIESIGADSFLSIK